MTWKPGDHCEGNENRKSQKSVIFTNWTILSDLEQKIIFRKISTDHPIWPFLAVMAPRRKLYLLKKFFSGPEIFRECSSQYYLPFLRVSEKSNVKKLF